LQQIFAAVDPTFILSGEKLSWGDGFGETRLPKFWRWLLFYNER
jgi:hypothetical protein